MKLPGSQLMIGGAGLAAACAVVCCSVPLLAFALPTLALLIGGAGNSLEVGIVAAVVVGILTGIGLLVWRRRHTPCSQKADRACGCPASTFPPSAKLHSLPTAISPPQRT